MTPCLPRVAVIFGKVHRSYSTAVTGTSDTTLKNGAEALCAKGFRAAQESAQTEVGQQDVADTH
jgi:hypothetical protein